jgi:hypothetical protein
VSVTIRKDAPPFVRFEFMEFGINAEATAKAGRPIPAVKAFALIMQHGSKDVVEKDAEEWLQQIKEKAMQGMYNSEWVTRFKMQYEEFCKGNELPRDGTPIRTWLAVTREQGTRLLALGITTVEDLAAVPDAGLGNIGLDGRNLRDLARNYIEAGQGIGVMAKKLSDLEERDRQNSATIERMSQQLAELKAQLPKERETLHAKRAA